MVIYSLWRLREYSNEEEYVTTTPLQEVGSQSNRSHQSCTSTVCRLVEYLIKTHRVDELEVHLQLMMVCVQ